MSDNKSIIFTEEERRQVLRQVDIDTHDAIITINASLVTLKEYQKEQLAQQKVMVQSITDVCQRVAVNTERISAIEKGRSCPMHTAASNAIQENTTTIDSIEKDIKDNVKPSLDKLWDRYTAGLVGIVMLLLGVLYNLFGSHLTAAVATAEKAVGIK
jgi:hypothetical protein